MQSRDQGEAVPGGDGIVGRDWSEARTEGEIRLQFGGETGAHGEMKS